ncbi:RBBP9/YdeN family alpha/beta hydrolase [Streptomyces sp. G5(2025)]|uniref:RBBP9/YdeN family alpha/beta hydrolase n=1 Tax=Streptomyces sp. G5(2025) TaxID=3406628 RepID=UPI003C1BDD85
MASLTHVFLAGIDNSGPRHWQSQWSKRLSPSVWVEHSSWDEPVRDRWVAELDSSLRSIQGPKLVIAHSLGCTLLAEWAAEHQDPDVVGAFLVAVPDVNGANFPRQATGFDSARHGRLPFPSVVVASETDPYASVRSATANAELFSSSLINVGDKGHINEGSDLGDWQEGWTHLHSRFPPAAR